MFEDPHTVVPINHQIDDVVLEIKMRPYRVMQDEPRFAHRAPGHYDPTFSARGFEQAIAKVIGSDPDYIATRKLAVRQEVENQQISMRDGARYPTSEATPDKDHSSLAEVRYAVPAPTEEALPQQSEPANLATTESAKIDSKEAGCSVQSEAGEQVNAQQAAPAATPSSQTSTGATVSNEQPLKAPSGEEPVASNSSTVADEASAVGVQSEGSEEVSAQQTALPTTQGEHAALAARVSATFTQRNFPVLEPAFSPAAAEEASTQAIQIDGRNNGSSQQAASPAPQSEHATADPAPQNLAPEAPPVDESSSSPAVVDEASSQGVAEQTRPEEPRDTQTASG